MAFVTSPLQIKMRFTKLMKVAFILLLIGFSISLIPTLAMGLFLGGIAIGSYVMYYLFYFLAVFGGTILSGLGSLLALSGFIILLIALAKLAVVSSNPEFIRKSKITMVLFIVTLSINFLVNLVNFFTGGLYSFLYSFIYSFYGYGTDGIFGYVSLVVTGLFIATYIMLGFTMKELKTEAQVSNRGLISAYIYPIVLIPQLIQLIDFTYSSYMIVSVVFVLGGLAEFIVLIFLASEGLVASSKILRRMVPQSMPVQFRPEPTFTPQKTLPTTGKGANYCIKCGSPLIENAKFCGTCGHIIE